MGEFIIRLWALAAAVYCLVQAILVFQSYLPGGSAKGRSLLWGLITAAMAVLLGSIALGVSGPLFRSVLTN